VTADDDELEVAAGPLAVFAYATSRRSDLYVPVMEAVVAAGERLILHVRPREVAEQAGVSVEDARTALARLTRIGCIDERHDRSSRPRDFEDFYKQMSLFAATNRGRAAHRAVRAALEASIESPGRLQASSLEPIRDRLASLASALGGGTPIDPAKTSATITELHALGQGLHRSAQAYLQELDRRVEDVAADDEAFRAYKSALVAYLGGFLDVLDRLQPTIVNLLHELSPHFDELAVAAGRADEGPGVDVEGATRLALNQLVGIDLWFRGSGREPIVAELRSRMHDAIGVLLDALRRLAEVRARRASRKADFMTCARWLAAAGTDDEAACLFGALFGLQAARHPSLLAPEETARRISFAEAAPVEVPVSLRVTGRRTGQGRAGQRSDYSATKAALRRRRADEEAVLAAAANRFRGRHLRLSKLVAEGTFSDAELSILLAALDGATRDRPALDQPAVVDSLLGLVGVTIYGHEGRVRVPTRAGVLEAPDWELRFGGRAGVTSPRLHGGTTSP